VDALESCLGSFIGLLVAFGLGRTTCIKTHASAIALDELAIAAAAVRPIFPLTGLPELRQKVLHPGARK